MANFREFMKKNTIFNDPVLATGCLEVFQFKILGILRYHGKRFENTDSLSSVQTYAEYRIKQHFLNTLYNHCIKIVIVSKTTTTVSIKL